MNFAALIDSSCRLDLDIFELKYYAVKVILRLEMVQIVGNCGTLWQATV